MGGGAQNKLVFHLLVRVGGVEPLHFVDPILQIVPSLKIQFRFMEIYKMECWFHKPFLQNGFEFFPNHFDGKDAFSTKWVAGPFQ